MPVSDVIDRKMGVPSSTQNIMTSLDSTLDSVLKKVREVKNEATVADIVRALVSKDQNITPGINFKELGIDVGKLFEISTQQVRETNKELHDARKEALETKKEVINQMVENKSAELGVAKELVGIVAGIQAQSNQQLFALLDKLNEERFKRLEESNKPKEDPIRDLLMQITIDTLKQRIATPSNQDPKSKLQETIDLLDFIKKASVTFMPNNTVNPVSEKLEILKIEAEKEKNRLQLELEREERQERLKFEERKTERITSVFEKIAELAGAVLPQFLNRSGGQIMGQGFSSSICPNCGENVNPSMSQCPRCKLPLRSPVPNMPTTLEQQPIASKGGGLDI